MAYVPVLGAVGAGAYLYLKGTPEALRKWAGADTKPTAQAAPQQAVQAVPPPPQVVVVQPDQKTTRSWLAWSSTALVGLAAYYYYIHKSGTKKVINKVESTAHETQDVVRECDDNNQERFEQLDERNQERTDAVSAEIRGESRAHFEILSKQLFCVTQVCLQTLNAVANGITGTGSDEFSQRDEKLISYTEKAQEMSDHLFDNDTYLKARDLHVDELRAELGARKLTQNKDISSIGYVTNGGPNDYTTPGGPDDAGGYHTSYYEAGGNVRTLSAPETPGNQHMYEEQDAGDAHFDYEEFSLVNTDFVRNLELSITQRHLITKFADPPARFVAENKKSIVLFGVALLGIKAISSGVERFSGENQSNGNTLQTATVVQ